jgi:hypothetical protein
VRLDINAAAAAAWLVLELLALLVIESWSCCEDADVRRCMDGFRPKVCELEFLRERAVDGGREGRERFEAFDGAAEMRRWSGEAGAGRFEVKESRGLVEEVGVSGSCKVLVELSGEGGSAEEATVGVEDVECMTCRSDLFWICEEGILSGVGVVGVK